MRVETFQSSLDELDTDLLVLTLFENERPPKGVCGLLDWRLNGFVSRMILSGVIQGKSGETTLIPLPTKLRARRLLLLGLGKPQSLQSVQAKELAQKLKTIIEGLKIFDMAVALPEILEKDVLKITRESVISTIEKSFLGSNFYFRWLDPKVATL